jgi:ankyrin repeat protein
MVSLFNQSKKVTLKLIKVYPDPVSRKDKVNNMYPFQYACLCRHSEAVLLLLSYLCPDAVQYKRKVEVSCPLHDTCFCDHLNPLS